MKGKTEKALDNLDTLWATIRAARAQVVGEVLPAKPKGSVTIAEYSEQFSVESSTASRHLRRLVDNGLMKQELAMVQSAQGRMVVTKVYIPC